MATIAMTTRSKSGAYNITLTTMTASDTLTYTSGVGQEIEMTNPTSSAITVVFNGSIVNTIAVAGYGSVTTSGGKSITVPASGGITRVPLDAIQQFLSGTISITNGTGLIASFTSN